MISSIWMFKSYLSNGTQTVRMNYIHDEII